MSLNIGVCRNNWKIKYLSKLICAGKLNFILKVLVFLFISCNYYSYIYKNIFNKYKITAYER